MAGPWERYQRQPEEEQVPEGPWTRYQSAPEAPPQDAASPGALGFLNRGIADTLGAPLDFATWLVNKGVQGVNAIAGTEIPEAPPSVLGSESIGNLLQALGARTAPPDAQPQNALEHFAVGAGSAAGALPGMLGAASHVARTGGPMARSIGEFFMEPFRKAPVTAAAAEALSGGGASLGADIGQRIDPESSWAPLVGALTTATGAGSLPYMVRHANQLPGPAGAAIQFGIDQFAPFSKSGAMGRARTRIADLVEDPDVALQRLNEDTIGNLSPAVSTGDRRLMALERTVRDTDPVVDAIMREREAASMRTLADEAMRPGQGVPVSAARSQMDEFLAREFDRIDENLNKTLGQPDGVRATETGIRERSQPARRAAYNRAYNSPIDYSSQEGMHLQDLLSRVEKAAPGTIAHALRMMAAENVQSKQILAHIADDGTVTFERLPDTREFDYITRALNDMADRGDGAGKLGGQTDWGRAVKNLSQEIRETLRLANPAYDEALRTAAHPIRQREALLIGREILKPGTARDVVQEAISGMTEGEMNYVRQGLRSELDEKLANIRSTLADPETGMQEARATIRELSSRAAREKINMLLPPEDAASFFRELDEAAAALDTRRSGPAIVASAKAGKEIRNVFEAENPKAAMAQIVAEAGKDKTGKALAGVKTGVLDELLTRAKDGVQESGESLFSGSQIRAAMSDPKIGPAIREALTPDELDRLDKIATELVRLETARGRLPEVGGVMEGGPNSLLALIVRTVAARTGARAGHGVSGASLVTASYTSRMAKKMLDKLTNDHAEALIRQAVAGDRDLFKILLSPPSKLTDGDMDVLKNAIRAISTGTALGATAGLSEEDEDDER